MILLISLLFSIHHTNHIYVMYCFTLLSKRFWTILENALYKSQFIIIIITIFGRELGNIVSIITCHDESVSEALSLHVQNKLFLYRSLMTNWNKVEMGTLQDYKHNRPFPRRLRHLSKAFCGSRFTWLAEPSDKNIFYLSSDWGDHNLFHILITCQKNSEK